MSSKTKRPGSWAAFCADPNPLAKVREFKNALPEGPGLPAMYREIRTSGTVLGVPVLHVGRNIFVPRQRIVERVEGSR